ncbi:MAG TPA: hypothetical protein V6D47_20400 [Oscillatoriaceae cyanobacterium]
MLRGMLHPIPGVDETRLRRLTSIAGRGYRADSHLFLTIPAVLMAIASLATLWRSASFVLATLVGLNGVCVLAAMLGLMRLSRTLRRLKVGRDAE